MRCRLLAGWPHDLGGVRPETIKDAYGKRTPGFYEVSELLQ